MLTPPRSDSPSRSARPAWLALAAVLAVAVLVGCFASLLQINRDAMAQAQDIAARSRIQTLETVLSRQRAVATVLADDAVVREALLRPDAARQVAVSVKLERLRAQTESAVIYLLDRDGMAVSASNWDDPQSFVGQNYSFRDYFSQALLRSEATQFALGTVSGRAGLYLSHDVMAAAQGRRDAPAVPIGVIVVKVEFDALESNWASSGGMTYVQDKAGQVILTSQPSLRFQTAAVQRHMIESRSPVPGTDWVLTVLGPSAPAFYGAALGTGTAGFVLLLAAVGAGYRLRARARAARAAEAARRYRSDLERAVQERTRALSDEMRERRAAEDRLDRLHADLVQANKLAALGQITAGVAHEVNQPLATIRLLAENGEALLERGALPDVAGNLGSICRMADRIGRITEQLRGFARKATGQVGPVSLAGAVEAAALLTASRREASGIRLELPQIDRSVQVMAETVRLEQILVNLLQNAQEALADTPDPRITLKVTPGQPLRVAVIDNGPGLDPVLAPQLFTPFATSKPNGLGLGLVISQEIARDFGGDLWLDPAPLGQGATFILELRGAE